MCGRFVGYRSLEELKEFFPIDHADCEISANYNVAPSQEILVIFNDQRQNRLDKFHWGLVPFWAKDVSIGVRMINARAETVAEKPAYKNAFKRRRCLIPADGFYEWKGPRGQKQPMFITLPDKKPFAFAGLYEIWRKDNRQNPYRSCTIITTRASEAIRDIHHRMPLILKPDAYAYWLNPANRDVRNLKNLLQTECLAQLISHPVSKQINSTRVNDASCVNPIG